MHRTAGGPAVRRTVTVIMPVRNGEGFVARSLGAVLDQDYPPELVQVQVKFRRRWRDRGQDTAWAWFDHRSSSLTVRARMRRSSRRVQLVT